MKKIAKETIVKASEGKTLTVTDVRVKANVVTLRYLGKEYQGVIDNTKAEVIVFPT